MNGFRKGLLILLSALPALVLLIVLTGSWRMLLTPAVIAFLKDVMRMLWCGLFFGVGMSVFLFVAFTMFDHAKDSCESRKCIPYLTVSLLLPVVGLWAACKLADQPSTGNGVGLLLGVVLGVLLFEQVWPRLSPAWVSNYLTGLAAQAPPFKAGVSRLYVSLVLYILLHDGEWGAAYGGDEVAVGPQGGDPAFE